MRVIHRSGMIGTVLRVSCSGMYYVAWRAGFRSYCSIDTVREL